MKPSAFKLQKVAMMALAFAGCSDESMYIENLRGPSVVWEHSNGLCSVVRAVDRDRSLWHDRGCEDGQINLDRIGKLSEEQLSAINGAVSLFPPPSNVQCMTGLVHTFSRREQDGGENEWEVCAQSTNIGDLAGLPEPYLTVATELNGRS